MLNDSFKIVKQLLFDHNLNDEVGDTATLTTVADQEFIDLSLAASVDLDQPIFLTERVNDRPIEIIDMPEYRRRLPDPSADTASTPDYGAFFANRLYLGPRPTGAISIFMDYIKLITDLTSANNSPFEDKYDPLLIAMVKAELAEWQDSENVAGIQLARNKVASLENKLIIGAAKNSNMNQQAASRRAIQAFGPRKVIN